MKNKHILIPLFILFLISFAIAEDFTIDKYNRLKSYSFVKGSIATFKFENMIYTIKMGDIDFENERVTIMWVSPRLGTEILNLNEHVEIDLNKPEDDEKDIKITLINYDEETGISETGFKGTAILMFEILNEPIIETTITTTTIKEAVSNDSLVAGEEITGSQVAEVSGIGDYKNWIIGGVIILILILILITRKNIVNFFKNLSKKDDEEEPKEHMPCPKCGRDIVIGDKYCIGCGAKLPGKPKFCTKCGEKIRTESKFCATCGAKTGK